MINMWCMGMVFFSIVLRIIWYFSGQLLVEEAYYWNYAQHLDIGYLDHPPMVAVLIAISTKLLGPHEYAVRFMSFVCWVATSVIMYRWVESLLPNKGRRAVFLLAILPFFFLQSWAMTPDQPLIFFWACALYSLFQVCVYRQTKAWIWVACSIGLGFLSKYTILLLIPSAFIYCIRVPSARFWFKRYEPYVALLGIALCSFPVIYWNMQHDWVSFAFQSSRRLREAYQCTVHHLLGLLILFLLPVGLFSAIRLFFNKQELTKAYFSSEARQFFQYFTAVPLCVFFVFSCFHPIKFNWIGPLCLALIPWLCAEFELLKTHWMISGVFLLFVYAGSLWVLTQGTPESIHRLFLSKFIDWQGLTVDTVQKAQAYYDKTGQQPLIVALDKYNIASELWFYQEKMKNKDLKKRTFPIRGNQVFGGESLMYRYWVPKNESLSNKPVLLIGDQLWLFNNPMIDERAIRMTAVEPLPVFSQGGHKNIRYFYTQWVKIKQK